MIPWNEINTSVVKDKASRDALDRINTVLRDWQQAIKTLQASGAAGGGSGAPIGSPFITVGNVAGLSAERAIAVTSPITMSDGGPNSSLTVGVNTAAPSGGYGTTALAGSAGSVLRSDARFLYPSALMSSTSNETFTFRDDGLDYFIDITNTHGLTDLTWNIQPTTQFGVRFLPDSVTAPNDTVVISLRPGVGSRSGINSSITTAGGISSATVTAWNANMLFGSAEFDTATLCAYRIGAISASPTVASDTANKMYGYLGANPTISNANGGWTEVAAAYFGGPKRTLSNPTVVLGAGIIVECPTVSATEQIGIYVKQQTAQQTAANRYGIKIDAQNSGTNQTGIQIAAQVGGTAGSHFRLVDKAGDVPTPVAGDVWRNARALKLYEGTLTHNLTPQTTKGDIVVHDGTIEQRLAVGADTFVLTADAAQATGVKWAAASAGVSLGLVEATALGMNLS